jgi:hypothetical protein
MDRIYAGKSLRLRDIRVQIPYAAEQGNKSDEQGDKIDDQGIKSTEHGTARQTRSGGKRDRVSIVRRRGEPPAPPPSSAITPDQPIQAQVIAGGSLSGRD